MYTFDCGESHPHHFRDAQALYRITPPRPWLPGSSVSSVYAGRQLGQTSNNSAPRMRCEPGCCVEHTAPENASTIKECQGNRLGVLHSARVLWASFPSAEASDRPWNAAHVPDCSRRLDHGSWADTLTLLYPRHHT